MTSALSKEDVEDALRTAGIVSPYIRQRLMRLIEAYARKYPAPPDSDPLPPVADAADHSGYKYMCPVCTTRKHIGDFPEYKKANRRSPVPCLACKDTGLTSRQGTGTIRK